MGVLSLSYHCCIRVVKQSLALMNAGVPMEFIARNVANREMAAVLPKVTLCNPKMRGRYFPKEVFGAALRKVKADLVHVHNEPDWLVTVAKAFRPDLPVVYDCHDLNCMRKGKAAPDEVLAMRVADAYIFPSIPYMEGAVRYHNLPDYKPREVVYSMCLKSMIVDYEMPRIGGIAYEGGLVAIPDNVPEEKRIGAYRDYRGISVELAKMGIPFTVYSGNNKFMHEYMLAGAIYISTLPHQLLLRELTRHDWGFVGFPIPDIGDSAMPNKLFEYMTAGIPIIVLNAAEVATFVEKHGIGVVIDKVSDIPKVYNDHEKYRKRVKEVRHDHTMETQVPKIKALYERITESRTGGIVK